MTGTKTPDRAALDRLADVLVEDILDTPDQDILAESRESGCDPDREAAETRALFETSILLANKGRLAEARAAVAQARGGRGLGKTVIDITEARKRLRAILDVQSASRELTLAARKESELSDADIIGMLEDLHELGILPPEDNESEKD